MGFGHYSNQRRSISKTRQFCVTSLAVLVAILPMQVRAASTGTVPFTTPAAAPPPAGQSGAQQGSGNTNSLAQGLSAALGIVSIGLGGLFIAKGVEKLSCCSQTGCDAGLANQSGAAAAGQTANGTAAGGVVTGSQPAQFKIEMPSRYDQGVKNECPKLRKPSGVLFSLMDLLMPQKAEAGGCIDAMISMATGGLMLLSGIMSLAAASQAGKNANQSYANADGMSTYPGGVGTSPTPDSLNGGKTGSSKLGMGGQSGELVKVDPSLLRTGKANDIMGQFENKFGINRDDFARSVLGGEDPRKILGSAPRNALSNADMNRATQAANGMSDADKANALNAGGLADAQREMALKFGDPQYEVKVAGSGASGMGSASRAPAKASEELDALDALNKAADAGLNLSPEVQAALLQKALDEKNAHKHELSLFQIVHNKYREKSKMIFGYDPDPIGKMSGVGNADGL